MFNNPSECRKWQYIFFVMKSENIQKCLLFLIFMSQDYTVFPTNVLQPLTLSSLSEQTSIKDISVFYFIFFVSVPSTLTNSWSLLLKNTTSWCCHHHCALLWGGWGRWAVPGKKRLSFQIMSKRFILPLMDYNQSQETSQQRQLWKPYKIIFTFSSLDWSLLIENSWGKALKDRSIVLKHRGT